ncbi:hypothetical protein T440DRAFT_438155 [Plenodomus tracheiphilus IPT5]|uniref:NAD(P)-binding protein n=1 Tax=Plenodomus tracheiphilus IPT5 TaxID=1408161 RepID=A0A6A7BQC2_9PLEO|nr:hypothetical protein T440DRAFT_438155 [Plenodomus tracheiphilus IPT5]
MVTLETIRAHNNALSSTFPPNLVAIFVGGTSGIGFFTAREFARHTITPHIYLIGRDASAAQSCIREIQAINPSSQLTFLQKDISLLRNVDSVCTEIATKESRVNLLFMTCGYLTLQGRSETIEGLDRKLALHYYTRMRFISQLQPLLTAAAAATTTTNSPDTTTSPVTPSLSRVLSVLDPRAGLYSAPSPTDLSLKHTFSLKKCFIHASAMQNLALYHFSAQHPSTSYIHAYPSGVESGVLREFGGEWSGKVLAWVGRLVGSCSWVFVPQGESGERHLWAATAGAYPTRSGGGQAGGQDAGAKVAMGSDGVRGSGSYLLNWDGEVVGDSKVAKEMREQGREVEFWRHTEDVFRKVCEEGGKY